MIGRRRTGGGAVVRVNQVDSADTLLSVLRVTVKRKCCD